jgi:hypothetical protein
MEARARAKKGSLASKILASRTRKIRKKRRRN